MVIFFFFLLAIANRDLVDECSARITVVLKRLISFRGRKRLLKLTDHFKLNSQFKKMVAKIDIAIFKFK